jgi:hypothetical protein
MRLKELSNKGVGIMQKVLNVRGVSALVAMPHLLAVLGFGVNERTHRAACLLHRGSNRSAFSWRDDGRWHCFKCGAGGDRIALVQAMRGCTFAVALGFLSKLAGVEVGQSKLSRSDTEQLQRQTEERTAHILANAEQGLLLELAAELESLRRLRRAANASLSAGKRPELCWDSLKFIADTLPRTDTAYCISAFAASVERAKFALHPELRPVMIDAALERGVVTNSNGYCSKVPLQ